MQNLRNTFQATRNLFRRTIEFIKRFNLFESIPPSEDPFEIRNQLISTRIFALSLSVCLLVLLFYNAIITVIKTNSVQIPTIEQYHDLLMTYRDSLTCLCTQISISNRKLVNIDYSLHQICLSSFVKRQWSSFMYDVLGNSGSSLRTDFRITGMYIFRALSSICKIAESTIYSNLGQFYSKTYNNRLLISEQQLQDYLSPLIETFKISTTREFINVIELVRFETSTNAYTSLFFSNAEYRYVPSVRRIITYPNEYDGCRCNVESSCSTATPLHRVNSNIIIFIIPGLFTSCYNLESVLQSSFECFYSEGCFRQLIYYLNTTLPSNITIMDPHLSSKYPLNIKVRELIDHLMIERWDWHTQYTDYFNECKPSICSYTYKTRNDFVFIITTLIGLIGGLVTALRFIVPLLVKIVRRKPNNQISQERRNLRHYIHQGRQYLVNFNTFPSKPPTMDPHELRTQILSTRIFLIVFVITLLVLFIYNTVIVVIKTELLKDPTFDNYEKIFNLYGDQVSCSCSKISVRIEMILYIEYTLHQLCTSSFVQSSWIEYLSEQWTGIKLHGKDFRIQGSLIFLGMKSLCRLVNETIVNKLERFYQTAYSSLNLLTRSELELIITRLFNQYRTSLTNEFHTSIRILRDASHANFYYTAAQTNVIVHYLETTRTMQNIEVLYDGCSCSEFSSCTSRAGLFNSSDQQVYAVPGLRAGCYIVESISQSSLECFFNQSCFDSLITNLNRTLPNNIEIMSSYAETQFSVTTTINQLLEQLLVEKWTQRMLYEEYFDECHPSQCIYTFETRHDLLYIITTLIGLIGGLAAALEIVIPRLVQQLRRKRERGTEPFVMMNFLRTLVQNSLKFIVNLNMFSSPMTLNNPQRIREEIFSTRVFIIVLLTSLLILSLYNGLVTVRKTVTMISPKLSVYYSLLDKYPDTLTCLCSRTAIEYRRMVAVEYGLHQSCLSDFITTKWSQYLYESNNIPSLVAADFRRTGKRFFDALALLCQSANETIHNNLIRFYQTEYGSNTLLSPSLLDEQAFVLIDDLYSSTLKSFKMTLDVFRDFANTNLLLSALNTNGFMVPTQPVGIMTSGLMTYGDCVCSIDDFCTLPSAIYQGSTTLTAFVIPGLHISCYVIDSIAFSSLECFYNQTCLDTLILYINYPRIPSLQIMDPSIPSRFSTDTRVQTMLDDMMTETWDWVSIYDEYFDACQPSECTYSYKTRNDLLSIIMIEVSLVGGLVKALRILVPYSMSLLFYITRKCKLCRRSVRVTDNT